MKILKNLLLMKKLELQLNINFQFLILKICFIYQLISAYIFVDFYKTKIIIVKNKKVFLDLNRAFLAFIFDY